MIFAIAFVPAEELDLLVYVNQIVAHCSHRGYKFSGLARDWPTALKMMRGGMASVVVFARQEHQDPNWEPRIEICGEDTQELFRKAPGPETAKHHRGRPHIVNGRKRPHRPDSAPPRPSVDD